LASSHPAFAPNPLIHSGRAARFFVIANTDDSSDPASKIARDAPDTLTISKFPPDSRDRRGVLLFDWRPA